MDHSETYNTIAVFSLNHVGDVLFTTPALAALKRRFPAARLLVLTTPGSAPVLRNNPNVQEILLRTTRSFLETCRIARRLQNERVDLVVDLSAGSVRLNLLAWMSGARRRIGFARAPLRFLLTDRANINSVAHQMQNHLDVVALVGAEAEMSPPELFLTDEERSWAADFLDSEDAGGGPIVGLSPGTTVACKRWPPEHYAALGDLLVGEGARVILFGSKQELSLSRQIASWMRAAPIVATGRTSLRELAALIAACDVFVGGDTGPLHVATAVGTPAVGIYGPTDPARTGPVAPDAVVIRRPFPCSPCGHHPTCRHIDCLRAVEPHEVLEVVANLITSSQPTRLRK